MFYLAGYLLPAGVISLVDPALVLEIFQSDRDCAAELVRFAGALMTGLGVVVVHLIRYRAEQLYSATLIVRLIISSKLLGIWISTRNPMFLYMGVIVIAGFLLTLAAWIKNSNQRE